MTSFRALSARTSSGGLPPDGSGELSAMPLRDLLTTFFNLQGRLIPARAPHCHISAEMRASRKFTEHKHALETIINMIETGADRALQPFCLPSPQQLLDEGLDSATRDGAERLAQLAAERWLRQLQTVAHF
jgi:hypothetical protein